MNIEKHKCFKYKDKNDLQQKAIERSKEYILAHGGCTFTQRYNHNGHFSAKYEVTESLIEHLDQTEIWFTNGRRSCYYPDRRKIKIGQGKKYWYTYKRHGVGKYSAGLKLPMLLHRTLTLIHEYTHAVQHLEQRKFSEIETTLNEHHYVKLVSPSTLNRFLDVPKTHSIRVSKNGETSYWVGRKRIK